MRAGSVFSTQVRPLMASIPGWLADEEGEALYDLARTGIAELVHPVASFSQRAADDFHEPIELLFVDGSHEYELVLEDFEKWVPKVVDGGWVAFHDTTWTAGPRRVVGERIYRSRTFKDVRFVAGSTTVARRTTANALSDRARARYALAVKTGFWLASTPLKKYRRLLPKSVERLGRRMLRVMQ